MNIGFIDSGLGGLGIFREFLEKVQGTGVVGKAVYFADNAHFPFGNRNPEELYNILEKDVAWLVSHHDVKIVVLACNTATTEMIQRLRREHTDMKFVGTEPAVKPACAMSGTGKVAVLATEGTLASDSYRSLVERFSGDCEVLPVPSPRLVEMVEHAGIRQGCPEQFVGKMMRDLKKKKVDVVVLGCTHFTLVRKELEMFLPGGIQILDSNEPVARQAFRVVLLEHGTITKQEFEDPSCEPELPGDPAGKIFEENVEIYFTKESERFREFCDSTFNGSFQPVLK